MMSDIYRQAVLVLIWLGEDSGVESTCALRFLNETAAESGNFGINNQIRNDKQLFLDGNPNLDGIGHKHLLSLVEAARNKHADVVYQMPWFTRMWVVQEVMLASRALLCCGSYEMDWVDFAFATEILMGAFMSLKAAGYDMSVVARDFDGMAVWRGWKIVEMRQNFRIMSGGGFFVQSQYQQYGRFVGNLRNQDCKDDRDRVYALLGLRNSDVRINMVPDYKRTTFEVYAQFARLHLEHNDLEVLYDAGLGCRLFIARESDQSLLESDDYLPSWAPDFRKRFYEHWLPWHNEGQKFYAATELLAKVVIPDNDPRRIKFKAVLIGKVKGGGLIHRDKSYEEEKFPLSYMRDILKVMRDLFYKHNRLGKEYQNEEDFETALAHTIVSDGSAWPPNLADRIIPTPESLLSIWNLYKKHCLSEDGEVAQKDILRQQLNQTRDDFYKSLTTEAQQAWRYHLYLEDVFWGHRFFVMKGYIGLGPPPTTEGDIVALVDGSRYPFIVRQNGGNDDGFLLIGTCFVKGLMYGEAIRNSILRRRGGLMTLI